MAISWPNLRNLASWQSSWPQKFQFGLQNIGDFLASCINWAQKSYFLYQKEEETPRKFDINLTENRFGLHLASWFYRFGLQSFQMVTTLKKYQTENKHKIFGCEKNILKFQIQFTVSGINKLCLWITIFSLKHLKSSCVTS